MLFLLDQLGVRPLLDDLSLVEHVDAVGVENGFDPVGDHEAGFPWHRLINVGLDCFFGLPVEGWGSLVKHKNLGFFKEGSADGYSLFLASRQLSSFDPDVVFEFVLFSHDEVIGHGLFGSIFDFFFSGLGVVLDVVVDGAREEARFLTDPYQIFSEVIEVVVFELDSI